jgi:hypothetical protein
MMTILRLWNIALTCSKVAPAPTYPLADKEIEPGCKIHRQHSRRSACRRDLPQNRRVVITHQGLALYMDLAAVVVAHHFPMATGRQSPHP